MGLQRDLLPCTCAPSPVGPHVTEMQGMNLVRGRACSLFLLPPFFFGSKCVPRPFKVPLRFTRLTPEWVGGWLGRWLAGWLSFFKYKNAKITTLKNCNSLNNKFKGLRATQQMKEIILPECASRCFKQVLHGFSGFLNDGGAKGGAGWVGPPDTPTAP